VTALELARAGTRVKQLAATSEMSDATIYNWLKQDRIDRGEAEGATTSQQLDWPPRRPDPTTRDGAGGCSQGH
jgi:hypothetical protein